MHTFADKSSFGAPAILGAILQATRCSASPLENADDKWHKRR